jgi:hypothetical protein
MDQLRSSSIMDQGFGNVYKKVLKDKRLTQTAKLIHCYICSYAGGGMTAYPSVSLICYDLGIKDDTYYENMLCLRAYGYISLEQIRGDRGKYSNNIYTIEMFPEQCENPTIEKQWKEMIEKRKQRRKEWEKKRRTPSEQDTEEIDRTPSEPDTVQPSTDGKGTNTNSINIILLSSIWEEVKELVKKDLKSSPSYDVFIAPMKPVEYEDNTLIITTDSDWHRMIIEARYMSNICLRFEEVCKKNNIEPAKIVLRV